MSLDAAILRALRETAGGVSLTQLADRVGAPTPDVLARLAELRQLGFDIQSTPHLGCRLVAAPDTLFADDLLSRMPATQAIGRSIQVFRETTSTNDLLESMARSGVAEGAVVFAEAQSRGRGRLGRSWFSPPGTGLWLSVLLRPALPPQAITQITIAAATAVARAISRCTPLSPRIKWPNDLLLRGRKVAGILPEMHAELDRVGHVILGLGINANQGADDFPPDLRESATSLRRELGSPIDRAQLAVALLKELDADYHRICHGQFEAVADEWESRCSTLGALIAVHSGHHTVRGRAESLDADGALLVRTQHGHLERITGGDVTLERDGTTSC